MDRVSSAAMDAARLSRPARLLAAILPPGTTILDFRCGHGTDVEALAALGFGVAGWDPQHRPNTLPLSRRFDVVMCNYVLNVLEPSARADVLRAACARAGTAYFTVRADLASVSTRWAPHADGWLTPSGTFQRIYTVADVLSEFPGAAIVHADPSSITFRLGPELGAAEIIATP